MLKIRSFLLAILIVFTSLFSSGCESDKDVDEPPQASDSGVQAGETMAGESAGEAAGEESASGTSDAGEEPIVAGDLVSAGDEPEVAGDLVLPAGEVVAGDQIEDCSPEFQAGEVCDEPQPETDPACEPELLEEGEDCDDMPVPAGEESSEDAPSPDMGS